MSTADHWRSIEGAQALYDWFGYWPSFNDAEVVSLQLHRSASSMLTLYTWETTDELDSCGYHTHSKDVVVDFSLHGITDLSIGGFAANNVIAGLEIERNGHGLRLELKPCYGIAGAIEAAHITLRVTPGKPTDYVGVQSGIKLPGR